METNEINERKYLWGRSYSILLLVFEEEQQRNIAFQSTYSKHIPQAEGVGRIKKRENSGTHIWNHENTGQKKRVKPLTFHYRMQSPHPLRHALFSRPTATTAIMVNVFLLVVTLIVTEQFYLASAYRPYPDPGPDIFGGFCTTRRRGHQCCPGRDDYCTVPILDVVCYCDAFCNRTIADCCPDFWGFCLGVEPPPGARTDPPPFTSEYYYIKYIK